MAEEDGPVFKVEYLDLPEGAEPEEANWIKRAGRAKVTYPNGSTFEGTFDAEKIKQGHGVYVWMKPGAEEGEDPVEKARYEGSYKDGMRGGGYGRMVFPNGDIYEGQWHENKMHGEGSYTYKKTGDIYSGSWSNNKKNGVGRYEFAADSSIMNGTWVDGEMVQGSWEWKDAGKYDGSFKLGRPLGTGKFDFSSGIVQHGEFVVKKTGEEEEGAGEEGETKAPNVAWKGNSIVTC